MEERREIAFRVYRYNPQADAKPYYDTFKVELEKGITILRALNHVKENVEPRISYRHFCQAGICGSCAMKINGVTKLACTTQVWDELDRVNEQGEIVIEPMNNLPVIRDMVVDMDPVVAKMKKYHTWVEPTITREKRGVTEHKISEEDFHEYDAATDCINCASCFSECTMTNADGSFVSPVILLKAFRMNADERDKGTKERLAILQEDHGAWDCTHCYRCVQACVKNIDIMHGIHHIRHDLFKHGMTRTEGARHGEAFLVDIKWKGRLVEMLLPLRTLGIGGFLMSQIPFAVKMTLGGRVPPPPFAIKAIPGIKSVRSLYKRLDEKMKSE